MISARRSLENLEKQLRQLDSALSTSFSKLKRDLLEQEKTIEELKARIAKLEQKHVIKPKSPKSSIGRITAKSELDLTPLHLQILKHLMILQLESGKRYVTMRELASELYPDKSYDTIKATISEYIKKLHQQGFVEKIRRGKLFLSYTENALKFADNQRLNRMRELISKPES